MTTQVFNTFADFLARDDKRINGVSPEHAEEHPNYEADNAMNVGCWNCIDCTQCIYCTYCRDCADCMDCVDCGLIRGVRGIVGLNCV